MFGIYFAERPVFYKCTAATLMPNKVLIHENLLYAAQSIQHTFSRQCEQHKSRMLLYYHSRLFCKTNTYMYWSSLKLQAKYLWRRAENPTGDQEFPASHTKQNITKNLYKEQNQDKACTYYVAAHGTGGFVPKRDVVIDSELPDQLNRDVIICREPNAVQF